ncbi:glycosyltransferase [Candidatus Dependentiae bacterium]|nr:glycosyltransferase [Candidatus Dependentiae bacterium]
MRPFKYRKQQKDIFLQQPYHASMRVKENGFSQNSYSQRQSINFFTFMIPQNMRVLQIGCKNGYLLNAVRPLYGVGIEPHEATRNKVQSTYPHLNFVHSFDGLFQDALFDYVILDTATVDFYDAQELLERLHLVCHPATRIIVTKNTSFGEWILSALRIFRRSSFQHSCNRISKNDLRHFLYLSGYDYITGGKHTLLSLYLPLISALCNNIVALLPGVNFFCLREWMIIRPAPQELRASDYTVSIVIPCRNERDNIEAAIIRTPTMGRKMEFIFVEGHSQDGTLDEIKRVMAKYPEKNISCLVQDGKGKGDAVRKGFAHAQGDILMILDADLTMPPEELPKFLEALLRGKGELINGSRLIYGMEQQAMRPLNFLVNHGFSLLFTWLLGQRITDTLCGTKVLFKKDYQDIVCNRSYFGEFDPFGDFDLLFGAAKLNRKIVDMPVHYKSRSYGTSQISRFRGGFMLLMMSLVAFKKFKLHK